MLKYYLEPGHFTAWAKEISKPNGPTVYSSLSNGKPKIEFAATEQEWSFTEEELKKIQKQIEDVEDD